ncbi:MAG: TIGR04283 family arsenosugar biosynthesis glycosyltransferase [Vulcanimicrobiaceae bacterium]
MMISVVTPAFNEAQTLPLRAAELAQDAGSHEWIVVDGGSEDDTLAVARRCGARVVPAPRSRGLQQNAGAAVARGEALLFLHADTALPQGALAAIRAVLLDPRVDCGNFTFRFADDGRTGAFLSWWYVLQQRAFGVCFGDSALWVRRAAFEAVAGFPDEPIMEDYALVRKLLARGGRASFRRLPLVVRSSARRYRGRPLRTIALWALMLGLYHVGVAPKHLARLYPSRRASDSVT